jgi:Tfp pilus assembly protein PilO
MNFSKLPRDRRNKLILVVLGTIGVLAGLGFGLIKGQYESLKVLADKKVAAAASLEQMRNAIKNAAMLDADLANEKQALATLEEDLAPSAGAFSWMLDTLRRFKTAYKVELPQYSPMSAPGEVNLLPAFPYKQASITVAGTAHYHDLGRFIADFENQFPHIRLLNLSLDLDSNPQEPENLAFRMEIVTLVKPNAS